MNTRTQRIALALLPFAAASAQATVTIDQAVAMAGTLPGDTAGFPITITQPGHYLLTSNLVVPPNINAIVIQAEGVTLDLGGYRVSSDAVCEQNSDTLQVNCRGVRPIYEASNFKTYSGLVIEGAGAVVRNGAISGFRAHGMFVSAKNVAIDSVRAYSNQYHGFSLGGPLSHARISGCAAFYNGGDGVYGGGAFIERTNASNNGGRGVYGWPSAVVDSTITYNGQHGVEGWSVTNIASVRGSLVFGNRPLNIGPHAISFGGNNRGNMEF